MLCVFGVYASFGKAIWGLALFQTLQILNEGERMHDCLTWEYRKLSLELSYERQLQPVRR